jgi:uncharacterized protein YyaL (SSP411 family)
MAASLGMAIVRYPGSFGNWACLFQEFYEGTHEISVVGKDYNKLKNSILTEYIPHRLLVAAPFPEADFPLLRGKDPAEKTAIWLCKNYACQAPVESVADLMSLIDNVK